MAYRISAAVAALLLCAPMAFGHGDVAPQPVNTDALPDVGEEWLIENPYRDMGDEVWQTAVNIGASGYNQNCARCHGLEVISGGLAPDLRWLEAEEYGDEWYMERYRFGYTQNGVTKMPAFEELLGQKAGWAIRTYIEARPDDGALDDVTPRLKEIRDQLVAIAGGGAGDLAALQAELAAIAEGVETGSGAPVADSAPFRAANFLAQETANVKAAHEALTIGLSAAQ